MALPDLAAVDQSAYRCPVDARPGDGEAGGRSDAAPPAGCGRTPPFIRGVRLAFVRLRTYVGRRIPLPDVDGSPRWRHWAGPDIRLRYPGNRTALICLRLPAPQIDGQRLITSAKPVLCRHPRHLVCSAGGGIGAAGAATALWTTARRRRLCHVSRRRRRAAGGDRHP